jgi:hypothetical protein
MQRAHIDISRDLDGDPVVFACFDLRQDEVMAARHAVQAVASERYRMSSMSADDVLEMRELTALAEELTGGLPVEIVDGPAPEERDSVMRTIVLRPARLTILREALAEFMESRDEAEWIRDEDREPLAIVRGLLFPLEQLCHEALRAALSPESRAY